VSDFVDVQLEAGDEPEIRRIETAAFGQPDEAHIIDAVRDSDLAQISLVARVDGVIVGHALFCAVEAAGLDAGALGPIGVDPSRQGEGIGGALIRDGLARCATLGWQAVFVLGDPGYYSRFGFIPAEPFGYFYGRPRPSFQVQFLEQPGATPPGGPVRYHSSFG